MQGLVSCPGHKHTIARRVTNEACSTRSQSGHFSSCRSGVPVRPQASAALRTHVVARARRNATSRALAAPDKLPVGAVTEEAPADKVAVALARVAWETKAEDVVVLHVAEQASWCSYMVFATIFSRPQLNAIMAKLEKEATQAWGREIIPPSGKSAWEIMDLGDIIVHVMSAEMREHYALESFYSAAEEVPLPFIDAEAAAASGAVWRTEM